MDEKNNRIYLIRFYDFEDKPMMLKIGITSYEVRIRMQSYSMPFRKEIVFERKTRRSRDLEKRVKVKFNSIKVKESLNRGVKSEWFKYSEQLEKDIIELIRKK